MAPRPVSLTTLDFIAEHTSDIIIRADQQGKVTYISPSIRSLGYEPEEFLGSFRFDLIHPDDRQSFVNNSKALLAGQVAPAAQRQHRLRTADGEWVWIEGNPAVVCDAAGKPLEVVNVFRNVTRRREMEQQARDQSELLEATFRDAVVGKVLLDVSGRFLRVNRAFCHMVGRTEAELQGLRLADITHPDDLAADRRAMARLERGEIGSIEREKRYVRPDGTAVWAHVAGSVVRRPDGTARYFLADIQDLTGARAAEAALTESEARYHLIAENTSDMLVLSDLDRVITYVSPSVRQTGREPAEFVGKRHAEVLPAAAAADFARARAALLAGSPMESIRWLGRKDDGARFWMESRITVLRDPETGAINGFLDVVRDIEAQVAQEKALAEALTVKTQFLSNMSHEIRTPLTAVLGFAELLAKQDLDARSRLYVERIAGAGNGLLAIVNDILDFSRLEAGKFVIRPQPTNVAELCEETLHMFATQAEQKGLSLALHMDPALRRPFLLDGARLRQVLINLLGNAVKFTEAGGVVLRADLAEDDRMLRLEVEDTGPGLDRDQQAQLFQRFSQVDGSTARRHGGTGLGLAICRGVTEAMGGTIGVESEPGRRTVFRVALPTEPTTAAPEVDAAGETPTLDGVRVLVVDDHPANRDLARQWLETRGARVSEARGGAEALRALARRAYDVVLLDLRMPEIDGREVLRRLRAGEGPNRDVPVVAFTADVDVTVRDPAGFAGLVRKPVAVADLVSTIARARRPS